MQKQPLRVWLYARTADARPGVLEEQLNSLYREAERRGYTVVNGGAEHRCAGDLDRPALFAMLAAVRGGRVDAVMLTRLSRFSYHRLALYLILCFLQDHGVGLITTEYELRYILYLRGVNIPLPKTSLYIIGIRRNARWKPCPFCRTEESPCVRWSTVQRSHWCSKRKNARKR